MISLAYETEQKYVGNGELMKEKNGVTEATPHHLKTQDFRRFLILLFYDHLPDAGIFGIFM